VNVIDASSGAVPEKFIEKVLDDLRRDGSGGRGDSDDRFTPGGKNAGGVRAV